MRPISPRCHHSGQERPGHYLPVLCPEGDGYPATTVIKKGATVPVGVSAPGRNVNVYQTEHELLREMLRRFLVAEMQSSCGAGQCGRVVCGAVAALDSLLAAHPVNRRGRCRSCQRPGWLGRRRRVCMVYVEARYWLRQPTDRVQAHLASELGVDLAPPPEGRSPLLTGGKPRVTR
jgi:hypothetical protein